MPPGSTAQDQEREKAVLAIALAFWSELSQQQRDAVVALAPDVYDAAHERVHRALVDAARAGHVDVAAVGALVGAGDVPKVSELHEHGVNALLSPAGLDGHLSAVRQAAGQRNAVVAFDRLRAARGGDVAPALERVERAVAELRDAGAARRSVVARWRRMDQVEAEHREWLADGLVPFGELTIVAGRGGEGKSTLARAIVAAASTGDPLPLPGGGFGARRDPLVSVILTREENVGIDVKASLCVHGADLSRVVVLDGEGRADPPRPVTLRDLAVIEQVMDETGARLLVVDSLERAGGCDTDSAEEVTAVLTPLSQLAQRKGWAVLLIHHSNKANSNDARRRITGSRAIQDIPRQVLLLAKDREGGPTRLALVVVKSNCAQVEVGVAFDLEPDPAGSRFRMVTWAGAAERTSRDLLKDDDSAQQAKAGRGGARAEARAFLESELAAGPRDPKDVRVRAEGVGLSWRTVERAKEDGAAVSEEVRGPDNLIIGWRWRLPGQTANHTTPPNPCTPGSGGLDRALAPKRVTKARPDRHWRSGDAACHDWESDDEEGVA